MPTGVIFSLILKGHPYFGTRGQSDLLKGGIPFWLFHMADNIRISGDTKLVEFFKQFDPLLQQRDDKLLRQAEEIGRLREQLEQARRDIERLEAGKNVATPHHVPTPAPVVP